MGPELPAFSEVLQPILTGIVFALGISISILQVPREQHGRLVPVLLSSILILAMVIRLDGAMGWNSYHPDSPARLVGDEPGYDNTARELLMGFGFTWPGRVPLYSTWLAVVYALSGGSYHAVPYYQSFLGSGTVLLTFLLARRLVGAGAALIAAAWAACSYILLHQTFHLLSEVLYTPVLILAALSLWKAVQAPGTRSFLWAGFWVGTSNLIRPTLLLFPVFVFLLLLIMLDMRRAIQYGLFYLAASLAVVTPWVMYTCTRFEALIPLQTSNAILWQGSPEYYRLIHEQGYTYRQIWSEVLDGPGWETRDPNSIAGDRYWTRRALASIAAEPALYLRFAGEKLFTFWVGDPNADWGDTQVFDYGGLRRAGFLPRDAVQVMLARSLPVLALPALFLLRRKWRVFLPILTILVYFNILHALTHAESRLSEPLQPFLLIFIAGAFFETFAAAAARIQDASQKQAQFISEI